MQRTFIAHCSRVSPSRSVMVNSVSPRAVTRARAAWISSRILIWASGCLAISSRVHDAVIDVVSVPARMSVLQKKMQGPCKLGVQHAERASVYIRDLVDHFCLRQLRLWVFGGVRAYKHAHDVLPVDARLTLPHDVPRHGPREVEPFARPAVLARREVADVVQ